MEFSNFETNLVSSWYGDDIAILVEENPEKPLTELIVLASEMVEGKIKNELSLLTEGYISGIIGESFDNIQYHELINYYAQA